MVAPRHPYSVRSGRLGLGAIASGAAALGIFGLFAGTTAISVGAATGSPAAARGLAALVTVKHPRESLV